MPGSTPATSQLDWLISTTAMIVLSWSKATRDLLKSFGWGIRALHQLVAATNGAISSPPAPYHLSAGPRSLISLPPPASHAATAPDADRRRRVTRDGVALPRPRPMRTPQPASSIRPPSALKPAARCAPDKRRAPRFPNRATGHLRPCRADGIAVTSERKRNNKLQPIDARRHLHALNPEQRRAVEYGIGGAAVSSPALLVAAGAGTGKTKVLAHRVAHLILNGRDPQRLLLLTFTRRAAPCSAACGLWRQSSRKALVLSTPAEC